jgi:hypothetical protein
MSIQQGLCNYSGSLYAAWKGEVGDDRIWFSTLNGTTWAPQRNANDVDGAYSLLSSVGPGLAVLGTQMFLAWKGEQSDQTLWYSYLYDLGGSGWTVPSQIKGSWGTAASSIGPSLAAFNGKLYAAWKGASNESLWYSFFDGTKWNPQAQIAGATSSIGPSLATVGGNLYAMWKGGSDAQLWYAYFDGKSGIWMPQAIGPGFSAQDPPPYLTASEAGTSSLSGNNEVSWSGTGFLGVSFQLYLVGQISGKPAKYILAERQVSDPKGNISGSWTFETIGEAKPTFTDVVLQAISSFNNAVIASSSSAPFWFNGVPVLQPVP